MPDVTKMTNRELIDHLQRDFSANYNVANEGHVSEGETEAANRLSKALNLLAEMSEIYFGDNNVDFEIERFFNLNKPKQKVKVMIELEIDCNQKQVVHKLGNILFDLDIAAKKIDNVEFLESRIEVD